MSDAKRRKNLSKSRGKSWCRVKCDEKRRSEVGRENKWRRNGPGQIPGIGTTLSRTILSKNQSILMRLFVLSPILMWQCDVWCYTIAKVSNLVTLWTKWSGVLWRLLCSVQNDQHDFRKKQATWLLLNFWQHKNWVAIKSRMSRAIHGEKRKWEEKILSDSIYQRVNNDQNNEKELTDQIRSDEVRIELSRN